MSHRRARDRNRPIGEESNKSFKSRRYQTIYHYQHSTCSRIITFTESPQFHNPKTIMSFCLRVSDGRCLYLKDENKFGERRITAEEMTSEDDTRYWWTEDSTLGVLRSVFDPYGCISYQGFYLFIIIYC